MYIYISEKPSAYFCNTAELKRFFESDKYISNLYTTEEYPLIIWKKSFVGVARGSVTGFYICYLADIIQINPIEHGLHEWRHLHFERPELPKHYWALSVNLAKGCVSDLSY